MTGGSGKDWLDQMASRPDVQNWIAEGRSGVYASTYCSSDRVIRITFLYNFISFLSELLVCSTQCPDFSIVCFCEGAEEERANGHSFFFRKNNEYIKLVSRFIKNLPVLLGILIRKRVCLELAASNHSTVTSFISFSRRKLGG
jgi:hypothetical protein